MHKYIFLTFATLIAAIFLVMAFVMDKYGWTFILFGIPGFFIQLGIAHVLARGKVQEIDEELDYERWWIPRIAYLVLIVVFILYVFFSVNAL